jgi:hypothetical protein
MSIPSLFAQSPLRIAAAADLDPVLLPIFAQFQQATGIEIILVTQDATDEYASGVEVAFL